MGDPEGAPQVAIPADPPATPPPKPSAVELESSNLNPQEKKMAIDLGIVDKDQKPPTPGAPKPDDNKPPGEKPDEKTVVEKLQSIANLTDEQEHELVSLLDKNAQGLYFRQKKEVSKRQTAEAARDHDLVQLKHSKNEQETARKEAADKLESAEKAALEKSKDPDDLGDLLDEGKGKPNPPVKAEDKPLTLADLERIDTEKEAERVKQKEETAAKTKVLNANLEVLGNDAKTRFTDFDVVMDHLVEIMQAAQSSPQELGNMFPDKRQQGLVAMRIKDFLEMAAAGEELQEGVYNAADAGYELGKLHPKYKADGAGPNAPKKGDETPKSKSPEEIARMAANASKTKPSAGVGASGQGSLVSEDDLTVEQGAKLSDEAFGKLKRETRDRLLREA